MDNVSAPEDGRTPAKFCHRLWNLPGLDGHTNCALHNAHVASQTAKRAGGDRANVEPGYGATAIEFSRACACLDKLVNSNETV